MASTLLFGCRLILYTDTGWLKSVSSEGRPEYLRKRSLLDISRPTLALTAAKRLKCLNYRTCSQLCRYQYRFVAFAECGGYNRTIVIEAERMYTYGAMAWLAAKFVCAVP